jgi:drug/metabolite transporter (DMT)-like permease
LGVTLISRLQLVTQPIWVAMLSAWLLREKPRQVQIAGIALTLLGTLLIFMADNNNSSVASAPLLGNSLALLGAFAASGYLLIGRSLRGNLSLLAYVWLTYSFAAIALVIAALAGGETFGGVSSTAWLLILALALGPQLLGHTSFNWALRRLSATFVALSILGEPIGAALLAWWLLGESFVPLQLAGFLALLAGIFVAARAERSKSD